MTLGFPLHFCKARTERGIPRTTTWPISKRIEPRYVNDGPVFENVITGDAIDVTKFPAPKWHPEDGGRYIGTGSFNVTRDPDEGWINCGTYRVMIHDEKTVGFYISPGKHGRIMRDKYEARSEPMPVAIVVGCDPMSFLMASSEVPYGVCEYDVIGGIRGTPVDVVKAPITGLPVPANAEIVIEGFVQPGNVRPEGPFGEWMGYYGSDIRNEPVMDIEAIYHRNDPILLGCAPQRPPDEIARYRALTRSAIVRENIVKAGVPDVTAAWAHEIGTARLLLGVAIKQRYPRPRPAGRPRRRHVPRRRLCGPLRHRHRRRHRRVEPRGADLGDADPLRPGHLDRHHPQCLVAPRSTRASSRNARPRAISPTAAPSSTPAGHGTGATSSRR